MLSRTRWAQSMRRCDGKQLATSICLDRRHDDRLWQSMRAGGLVFQSFRADRAKVPDVQPRISRLLHGNVFAFHCIDRPTLDGRVLQLCIRLAVRWVGERALSFLFFFIINAIYYSCRCWMSDCRLPHGIRRPFEHFHSHHNHCRAVVCHHSRHLPQ